MAERYECLSVVDAVTALGGIPVETDAWRADVVYSGTQKCLSCPPGLSPITFGPRAEAAIMARNTPVQSWFLDMSLLMAYWAGDGARTYHHTAPVNAMYALHEALVLLHEEGLEASWARHQAMHDQLARGLEALGFEFLVDQPWRLPQLNAVRVPAGLDEASGRRRLLEQFNLEVGAGLGAFAGKVWRIGLMGYSARPANVALCLAALAELLG
jgi:alanine-glyoxylate transaminase/serine-glyoxylate transaminase/serine-pyruvate transaminase